MSCPRPYIAVINGPNLNRLGRRDPVLYGSLSLIEVNDGLCARFADRVDLTFFQSNHEGELIDHIQCLGDDPHCRGIVINPGAYAHTSLALADALTDFTLCRKPYVEVHISDIKTRGPLRSRSLTGADALDVITGRGTDGYAIAIDFLLNLKSNPLNN